jgi:hypothetical protein
MPIEMLTYAALGERLIAPRRPPVRWRSGCGCHGNGQMTVRRLHDRLFSRTAVLR